MEEPKDIKSLFKNGKPGGYSQLSLGGVLDFLGLKKTLFLKYSELKEIDLKDDIVDYITRGLMRLTTIQGSVDSGGEAKRMDFISFIISNVAVEYATECDDITLLREEIINGSEVRGPVDIVVVNGRQILIIVEAKKDDWEQGRAQNLMQLYNAHSSNIERGAPRTHIVYGIVTTGYSWEFMWCFRDSEDKLCWGRKQKIDPIETDPEKTHEQWKARARPLLATINYIISDALERIKRQIT